MKEKDLRRLGRRELVEIIYQMKRTEMSLRRQLEEAQQALEDRRIILENAGSIAEAALQINGVLEAAQAAAEDYLRSVRHTYSDVDAIVEEVKKENQE